ncbi:uncharacterized protein LOC111067640 isoform X2 [Drosophila obscura]|uniref:uncharacterized protein LOC111067640 isoform X2 n=1 Tax=Drosophila obscura TaxID=7282 RepID=UPI000BA0AD73|nr:uncharacterized protein LOC111067640 isoform X2 [Drosophila obscura]
MENGFIKRRSLTLSARLLHKRHSASPQNCGRPVGGNDATTDAPGSPSSIVGPVDDVECTPPNKKSLSLDDSVDFSPRMDISLSPNCLFSQTLATESPEVGWRWNRNSNSNASVNLNPNKINTTTDSGFDSAELAAGKLKDRRRQLTMKGCEDRRNQQDNDLWRAKQIRARELLKERCDKLHRQLDQVAVSETPKPVPAMVPPVAARTRSASKRPTPEPAAPVADPAFADFLNDSETDMFLLEASQQLESKMVTQGTGSTATAATTTTTPTSHHKTKRPSFYMKFLEDESESEDWLTALEEAVDQATMPKKPRTSLQRYKSMPTTGDISVGNGSCDNGSSKGSAAGASTSSALSSMAETPRIKRHASSHALSPATSHARGKLFGSRK